MLSLKVAKRRQSSSGYAEDLAANERVPRFGRPGTRVPTSEPTATVIDPNPTIPLTAQTLRLRRRRRDEQRLVRLINRPDDRGRLHVGRSLVYEWRKVSWAQRISRGLRRLSVLATLGVSACNPVFTPLLRAYGYHLPWRRRSGRLVPPLVIRTVQGRELAGACTSSGKRVPGRWSVSGSGGGGMLDGPRGIAG